MADNKNKTNKVKQNNVKRRQSRKDNKSKRVNCNNERLSKWEEDAHDETKHPNGIGWYSKNAELLRAAASLPYSNTTGAPLNLGSDNNVVIPGVMQLNWEPSVASGLNTSPVNEAAISTYSFVVHANSRNTSYNAADLFLTILAGMDVFTDIGTGIRALGTMRMFDQRNKYLPKDLIRAMGFNYEDLVSHLNTMWYDLNEVIARATQIWIPKTFPIQERWFWLSSNIFMDSNNIKAQYYVFNKSAGYQFNETGQQTGTSLDIIDQNPAGGYTWNDFIAMIRLKIQKLLDSEDRGTMMGDILKAYGPENIFALNSVPVDYAIQPVYNIEVLSQIENLSLAAVRPDSLIQTAAGQIVSHYTAPANPLSYTMLTLDREILNFHQTEVPTPEQNMIATRLKALGTYKVPAEQVTEGKDYYVPAWSGSELITKVAVIQQPNGNFYTISTRQGEVGSSYALALANELFFDWSPWIYLCTTAPTAGQPWYAVNANGDYDEATTIGSETLGKMHTTALYSEFGVPTI